MGYFIGDGELQEKSVGAAQQIAGVLTAVSRIIEVEGWGGYE